MIIRSQKLRSAREIRTGQEFQRAAATNPSTVYLGLYNGLSFIDSLLDQIQTQTAKSFPLIVADNSSTDESWNQILSWPQDVLDRAKLIRNPINLGGTGSFALNLDQVETEWVITMHQDDTYCPNHVSVLNKAIASSSEEEIVVFSDMGTQDIGGNRLVTPIRQSWIANLDSPQSAFRANLVQQSVSYPSAAFRMSGIMPIQIPWHSSSFPDTEITLLQASRGSFKFIPELTMIYRMNPKSESHDLNPKERVLGPFASLSRVMASDRFLELCAAVPERDRQSFSRSVLEGIDLRLGASPFSEMVKLIAAETMGMAWDYTEAASREQIAQTYKLAEDGRTTKLLAELGVFYGEGQKEIAEPLSQPYSEAQIGLEKLLRSATPPSNSQPSKAQRLIINLIGKLLPLPVRRRVVSFALRLYAKYAPNSHWNLSWTTKN